MAFALPSGPGSVEPNPTLFVTGGSRARIGFQNLDTGIIHDLQFPTLGLSTGRIRPGESATLDLRALAPGRHQYRCALHEGMMKGWLIVR